MSFALELSRRLSGHDEFNDLYQELQKSAAFHTVAKSAVSSSGSMGAERVAKLLYCATVFSQTDNTAYRNLAQSIALNLLLTEQQSETRRRSERVLVDVGNFPAVAFSAEHGGSAPDHFADVLRTSLSKTINTIDVGGEPIALTDFQKETWDSLPEAAALAISAPTSAGKSFLVIEHLCRTVENSSKYMAVYIAPTRALISEVFEKIQRRLQAHTDIRVSTVPTRDPGDSPRQIFVLTQERLQVLLALFDISFDLIVVDEAQNLSDGSRGMILQEGIDQALARNASTRLLMLAPGSEGFDKVASAVGHTAIKVAGSAMPSVVQNRIVVTKGDLENTLELSLILDGGSEHLGTLTGDRGFDHPASRLAAVVLELGQSGGSLIYSTGPRDSERVSELIASDTPVADSKELNDLAEFIEKHIHDRYGLANLVRKGVAFHYGKMPTLLREALETAFKSGAIRYLACTTTLFQGVNLPARNVFMDTPKRGSGDVLEPAAMWNFAGRAGRMRRDIVGNVFLVDYQDWPDKPMDKFVAYKIEPAFGRTLGEARDRLLGALNGDMPPATRSDEEAGRVRAAAGLLISRAARGDIEDFIGRTSHGLSETEREEVVGASVAANEAIGLPATLLATNWTVNPFGLKRLYDDLVTKIGEGRFDEIIPKSPHDHGSKAKYAKIFLLMQRCVNDVQHAFPAVAAYAAVDWMVGMPYPALLSKAVRKAEEGREKKLEANAAKKAEDPKARVRTPPEIDVNTIVRQQFDMIEDVLRFQYVQLGKSYNDLLALALNDTGNTSRVAEIFDFPLALELGVATRSGWSFMELGLSRIAASALEPNYPNSSLSVDTARQWLATLDYQRLRLSPVILDELRRLNLIPQAA